MKSFLTGFLVLAAFTLGSAQNVGLRVNYTLTNWSGLIDASSTIQTEIIRNISFGIYGHAPLSPSIVFEPGIFITPKGAKLFNGSYLEPTTNKSLYLDVPILLKMYIGGGGFHVNAGPQISYLLSNKLVTEDGGETDTISQMNSWDFAIIFGLAYDFKFGLNIGAQYDLGLSNMLINEFDVNYADWSVVKNQVIRLSLGYTIGTR